VVLLSAQYDIFSFGNNLEYLPSCLFSLKFPACNSLIFFPYTQFSTETHLKKSNSYVLYIGKFLCLKTVEINEWLLNNILIFTPSFFSDRQNASVIILLQHTMHFNKTNLYSLNI